MCLRITMWQGYASVIFVCAILLACVFSRDLYIRSTYVALLMYETVYNLHIISCVHLHHIHQYIYFFLHRFILIGFPLSYEKSPRTKQHPGSQEVHEMRCVHKPLDIDFLNWCKIMYEVLSIGESQTPMPGEGCAICVNLLQEEALGAFVHKN